MASLEFDCGTVVNSVGMPSLAIAKHIQTCKDEKCVADCKKHLPDYKNILITAN